MKEVFVIKMVNHIHSPLFFKETELGKADWVKNIEWADRYDTYPDAVKIAEKFGEKTDMFQIEKVFIHRGLNYQL